MHCPYQGEDESMLKYVPGAGRRRAAGLACLCLVLLIWLCALPARAQDLPLLYYSQNDGLRNLSVTALVQDERGYVWTGTENGLFRFNGAEFKRYAAAEGLAEQFVATLYVDRRKRLWAGSYKHLYLMKEGRFAPVLADGKALPLWPGQYFSETAKGDLLVIGGTSLYSLGNDALPAARPYFAKAQLSARPELDDLYSVFADKDGSLWLGCKESLCHVAGQDVKVIGSEGGLPAGRWTSIARDGGGTLWVRNEQKVFALPPAGLRFEDRSPAPAMLRKVPLRTVMVEDADGAMLINADPGLLRWRGQKGWEAIGSANGLDVGGGVAALLFDRERNAWLGTRGHGLVQWLGYGTWDSWRRRQHLPDNVILSFLRDDAGRMHVGTRSGHAQLEPGASKFDIAPVTPSLEGHQWATMAPDRAGRVWAGTYSGRVLRYIPDSGSTELMAEVPFVRLILPDRAGRMWIATENGLRVLPDNAPPGSVPEKVSYPAAAGIESDNEMVDGCADSKGHLWFTNGQQLLRHDGGSWHVRQIGDALGAEGEGLLALACGKDGVLWGSTGRAVWRIGTQGAFTMQRVDVPVLRDRAVMALHEDRRGWLWVGTDSGFAVGNGKRWRMVNRTHGLAWDDINGRGFYEDRDGSMWVATSNGASHIQHPDRLFEAPAVQTVLEAVLRGDAPQLLSSSPMAWSREPLVFHMASLTFQGREALRYRYRLQGLEENWTESVQSEVHYAGLQGGNYRFQFTTVNKDTGETSPLVEAGFSVRPPWWRSYPSYVLYVFATLLAFFLLHRYRLRLLTQRQAVLAELVKERTRELEHSQEELRVRALKDGLTRVWNRGAIMEILEREREKGLRTGETFVLVLLDLDFFKRINDTHGHQAGDAVLVEVTRRLSAAVRPYDSVGRYGGEEFIVLLAAIDPEVALSRVTALHQAIRAAPVDIGAAQPLSVTASFGVAAFRPQEARTVEELVKRADDALYKAKARGRDQVVCAGDGDKKLEMP